MKKLLVFSMVLSLIFPAYCFASPSRAMVKKDKLPIDENLVTEVMLILEDGVIEQSEIETLQDPPFEDPCMWAINFYWAGVASVLGTIVGGATVDEAYISAVSLMLFVLAINANTICWYW